MHEMEINENFKILTDLTHFFLDHRSACYTFVNIETMKNILDLKMHISKMLNISNFYLQFKEHYLPENEDIKLLKEGDVIRVIKMEELQTPSLNKNGFKPIANSTLLHMKEKLNASQDFQEKISYFERKSDSRPSNDLTDDQDCKTFKNKLSKILDKQIMKHKEQIRKSCYNTPINRFKLQCVNPKGLQKSGSYSTFFEQDEDSKCRSSLEVYDVTIDKPCTSFPKRMCTSLTISKLENKEL